jgi:hypothetical protein
VSAPKTDRHDKIKMMNVFMVCEVVPVRPKRSPAQARSEVSERS